MGGEILLYAYGIICLSMIAFNLIYGLTIRGRDTRMERRSARLQSAVEQQLCRLSKGHPVEISHIRWLGRKLIHIRYLMAFDQTLDRLYQEDGPQPVRQYLMQIRGVILRLAVVYRGRESLQAAYFAYFLRRHKIAKYMPMEMIQNILVDYMKKDSLYCRVNALKALCAFGSWEHILQAVEIQDQGVGFLHEKILTECLLTYTGDVSRLIQSFWEHLDEFSPRTKLGLLNYIRFQKGDYCSEMFEIMVDPKEDRELHFAAIRYFGRHQYPPAREKLLEFLEEDDAQNWEYAAISATALGSYEGEDVIDALAKALHSRNWYVRYNAAASLEAHHLSHGDLLKLVGRQDRYAREMILYRMELSRMEQTWKKETVAAV